MGGRLIARYCKIADKQASVTPSFGFSPSCSFCAMSILPWLGIHSARNDSAGGLLRRLVGNAAKDCTLHLTQGWEIEIEDHLLAFGRDDLNGNGIGRNIFSEKLELQRGANQGAT